MKTEIAQAVLAHQQGIRIDRHLEPEALAEVRRLLPDVTNGQPDRSGQAAQSSGGSRRIRMAAPMSGRRASGPRAIVFPDQFEYTDPILPEKRVREAREMASVYPLLYVLENSMRELIMRVMSSKYGGDWWETALTTGRARTVKNNADARRNGENHRRWHQRRGAHPIDYTDLNDLGSLILARRDDFFPDVLGGDEARMWIEHLMLELEPSRNVVCHMNPLSPDNVELVRIRLAGWRSLIEGRIDHIPCGVSS